MKFEDLAAVGFALVVLKAFTTRSGGGEGAAFNSSMDIPKASAPTTPSVVNTEYGAFTLDYNPADYPSLVGGGYIPIGFKEPENYSSYGAPYHFDITPDINTRRYPGIETTTIEPYGGFTKAMRYPDDSTAIIGQWNTVIA